MTLEQKLAELDDTEIKLFFKVCEESKVLNGVETKDLQYYGYWWVKVELPELLNKSKLTNVIEDVLKFNNIEVEVSEIDINEQLKYIAFCLNRYNSICEFEKNLFQREASQEEVAAGNHVFNKYGEYNTIDSIANGNALLWDQVKLLSYEYVITKLLKNKEEAEYNKRYAEIMRKKEKK